jgi:dCMP deaminase
MEEDMKNKQAFMDTALRWAQESYCKRLQVGCIIVKDKRIISIGYNGMPDGWENCCEVEVDGMLKSRPEVLHAEANAIAKLAKTTGGAEGSSLFCSHAPCLPCAKLIYQAGIKEVYYHEIRKRDQHANECGMNFLEKCGVRLEQV